MRKKNLVNYSNEELAKMYQGGGSGRGSILGMLYFKNSGLIKQIAEKYTAYESIEDLMQESFFGLEVAAELYDSEKGAAFSTYAAIWIRQALKRYIDKCGSCVRVPTYKRDQIYKYTNILNRFNMEFGREPTDRELSKLLYISMDEVKSIKEDKSRLRIISLDEPLQAENDEITIGDTIPGNEDPEADIINIVYNERISLILWDQVSNLEPIEQEVIQRRYIDNMTMKEAAADIGCNVNDIRNAEAKAFKTLRKNERIKALKADFVETWAYKRVSLMQFQRTNTSATEDAAIKDYNSKIRALVKNEI